MFASPIDRSRPRSASSAAHTLRLLVPVLSCMAPAAAAAQTVAASAACAGVCSPSPTPSDTTRTSRGSRARRPDYQALRFEERWPALRLAPTQQSHDPFDPLKHVALTPNGAVYVTLGGQFRWREERVQHFQLGLGADRADAFGLTRTSVGADVHAGSHLRVYGELRDAVASARTLPGGARPQDTDRWDAQNLFAEAGFGAFAGHDDSPAADQPTITDGLTSARIRAGRQELALGKERLIGPGDWSNARRTFDGVRVDLRPFARTTVTALRARPVVLTAERPNRADTNAVVWGGVVSHETRARATMELTALTLEQERATLAVGAHPLTGGQHRVTVDGRMAGAVPFVPQSPSVTPWLAYEVESGLQRGRLVGRPIDAWFVTSEITAAGVTLPLRPTLTFGYDRASGTRDSLGTVVGTFTPLYPSSHLYDGYLDLIGRQNLVEHRAVLTAQLPVTGQLRVAAHVMARASLEDAAYNKSGGIVRRATGDPAAHLGNEVDVTSTRPLGRHLKLLGGYGHFAPGAFLQPAPGGAHPEDWGFGGITYLW